MPRDASGNMTLHSSNPVSDGQTIDPDWANSTLSDIASEIQDSLSRSGKGGMLVAMQFSDGSASSPGLQFTSETNSGLYRHALNDVRAVIAGTWRLLLNASGVQVQGTLSSTGAATFSGGATVTGALTVTGDLSVSGTTSLSMPLQPNAADTAMSLRSRLAAGTTGYDHNLKTNSSVTRTATTDSGLLAVENNAVVKYAVDINGEPSIVGGLKCGRSVTAADVTATSDTWTTAYSFTVENAASYQAVATFVITSGAAYPRFRWNSTGTTSAFYNGVEGSVASGGTATPQVDGNVASAASTTFTLWGGGTSTIYMVTARVFLTTTSTGTVSFQFNNDGTANSVVLRAGGELRWTRIA